MDSIDTGRQRTIVRVARINIDSIQWRRVGPLKRVEALKYKKDIRFPNLQVVLITDILRSY